MAKTLPSKLFSTGGDEINAECSAQDKQTQDELKTSKRTVEQALDVFTQANHKALASAGKTPVVWEGVLSVVERRRDGALNDVAA